MRLTKIKIKEMANEIIDFLKKNELENDVCIYFNNKRISFGREWDREKQELIPYEKIEENINPLDYFKYANDKHILSMSFEGDLYDRINYGNTDKFDAIFNKYGVYYELGNAWNLTAYPDTIDYDDIEYTSYEREPEPTFIYYGIKNIDKKLETIMECWYSLSKLTGDIGSCVIGAGFKFKYKGNPYFMSACSPWQGSISWEMHTDVIKHELEKIGATEIYYDYGRID